MDKHVSFLNAYCCNPFQKKGHTFKNVRPVMEWMWTLNANIKSGMKICDGCRKQLSKKRYLEIDNEENDLEMPGPSKSTDEDFAPLDISLEYLNKSLSSLHESPIDKKRLHTAKYCKTKGDKIKKCLAEKVLGLQPVEDNIEVNETECEIINQLKEKFQQPISRSEKIQILTVLPKSWSCQKLETEFNISNRMARKVKEVVKEKGVLSTPDPKPGKTLHESVIAKVENFYNGDEVTRLMPGKKDFVSVKRDNIRVHMQKRLVLGNLKEIYELFKSKYPTEKIGFSKFAELRPKNCILAGGSGTHTVCVCTVHQNVKLMLSGVKLKEITLNDGTSLNSYKSCLEKIMCDPAQPECHLNECTDCPGIENLKEELINKMEEEMIEQITYKQWVSVDRCSFETLTKNTEDFLDSLCEQLIILKKHSFIAQKQSSYYTFLKENIKQNEAVVSSDFAENYSFVLQDEVQSYHWVNDQCTIYPVAVYFKDSEGLKFKSFVFISENVKHDTISVHLFHKKLIVYLLSNFIPNLTKIYYFSDGSAAQFKNRKNFSNLCNHKIEFGVDAEWHFYATAHGKGVCDGLGGTVKRLAARASLQRPYENQIMTPKQLFDWCQANIPSILFFYCTKEQHSEEEKLLEKRFMETRPIPGTQKFHCFLPLSTDVIQCKVYSEADLVCTFSLSSKQRLLKK